MVGAVDAFEAEAELGGLGPVAGDVEDASVGACRVFGGDIRRAD